MSIKKSLFKIPKGITGVQLISTVVLTNTPNYTQYNTCEISGDKIYYCWTESDGFRYQIWTAISDLDGSNFVATQRTTGGYDKYYLKFKINNGVMQLVWIERSGTYLQVFTGTLNLDGTGWTATVRTSTATNKQSSKLLIGSDKIYYFFAENLMISGSLVRYLWLGTTNLDGSGWTSVRLTDTNTIKSELGFTIYGGKIYYVFIVMDPTTYIYSAWTAESNLDGTSFVATIRQGDNDVIYVNLVVEEGVMYLCYAIWDDQHYQIETATMNIDGTNWVQVRQTTDATDKYFAYLKVSNGKAHYTYGKDYGSGGSWEAVHATANLDGTGWLTEKFPDYTDPAQAVIMQDNSFYFLLGKFYEEDYPNMKQMTLGLGKPKISFATGFKVPKKSDSLDDATLSSDPLYAFQGDYFWDGDRKVVDGVIYNFFIMGSLGLYFSRQSLEGEFITPITILPTGTTKHLQGVDIDIVGATIYWFYRDREGNTTLSDYFFATSNLDGTNFQSVKFAASQNWGYGTSIVVKEGKALLGWNVYLTNPTRWSERFGSINLDGTGFQQFSDMPTGWRAWNLNLFSVGNEVKVVIHGEGYRLGTITSSGYTYTDVIYPSPGWSDPYPCLVTSEYIYIPLIEGTSYSAARSNGDVGVIRCNYDGTGAVFIGKNITEHPGELWYGQSLNLIIKDSVLYVVFFIYHNGDGYDLPVIIILPIDLITQTVDKFYLFPNSEHGWYTEYISPYISPLLSVHQGHLWISWYHSVYIDGSWTEHFYYGVLTTNSISHKILGSVKAE